jgi:hypothetical protein
MISMQSHGRIMYLDFSVTVQLIDIEFSKRDVAFFIINCSGKYKISGLNGFSYLFSLKTCF